MIFSAPQKLIAGNQPCADPLLRSERPCEPCATNPWSPDIKASDEFLDRLFRTYFAKLGLPNLLLKTDYHILASLVSRKEIEPEVVEKLDAIVNVAMQAKPRTA